MALRSALLHSPCTRPIRAVKYRFQKSATYATTPSPSGRPWSHPPASATVSDEQIAYLAAQPIHQLTLLDLAKYIHLCPIIHLVCISPYLLTPTKSWPASATNLFPTLLGQFHFLVDTDSTGAPRSCSSKPSLHRRLQPTHIENIRQLSTLSPDLDTIPQSSLCND